MIPAPAAGATVDEAVNQGGLRFMSKQLADARPAGA
jgi:hypothetical protein